MNLTTLAPRNPSQKEPAMNALTEPRPTRLAATLTNAIAAVVVLAICVGSLSAAPLPVSSGLQFHVDASAITGLNPGDPVTTWSDLSSNSFHAVTRSGYANPTYQTEVIYGSDGQTSGQAKPVIRFDVSGGRDSLVLQTTNTAALYGGSTNWTTFAIFAKNSPNTSGFGIIGSSGNPSVGINLGARNDTAIVITYSGYGDRASAAFRGGNTKIFDIVMWDHNNSTQTDRAFINGASAASQGSSTSPTSTNSLVLGTFDGAGSGFNGDMVELIVYNRLLSAPERLQVEEYLYEKWFIPEPASFSLLALAGLAALRRRK